MKDIEIMKYLRRSVKKKINLVVLVLFVFQNMMKWACIDDAFLFYFLSGES
jgi:hypothetical protein